MIINSKIDLEKDSEQKPIKSKIIITGLEIPFLDMVLFLMKLAITSVPAGLLFILIYGFLTGIIGFIGLGALFNSFF